MPKLVGSTPAEDTLIYLIFSFTLLHFNKDTIAELLFDAERVGAGPDAPQCF